MRACTSRTIPGHMDPITCVTTHRYVMMDHGPSWHGMDHHGMAWTILAWTILAWTIMAWTIVAWMGVGGLRAVDALVGGRWWSLVVAGRWGVGGLRSQESWHRLGALDLRLKLRLKGGGALPEGAAESEKKPGHAPPSPAAQQGTPCQGRGESLSLALRISLASHDRSPGAVFFSFFLAVGGGWRVSAVTWKGGS